MLKQISNCNQETSAPGEIFDIPFVDTKRVGGSYILWEHVVYPVIKYKRVEVRLQEWSVSSI